MLKMSLIKSAFLFLLLLQLRYAAQAAIYVVAPTVTCIDKSPGNFTTIGNITIIEGTKSDFPSQTLTTFILTVPSGFEFNPGVGSVVWGFPTPSGNIDDATISVSSTSITILLTSSGVNKWDSLAIENIQVRALAYNTTGNILRLSGTAGGNAVMAGNAGGAGVIHGTLTSEGLGSNSSIASGNWSNPAIWSKGSIPSCGDTVFINHTVTVNTPVSTEFLYIQTTGNLISDYPVTIDAVFVINGNGTYTHRNTSDASTTIFKGTETFSTNSTLIISRWYTTAVPLPQYVTGNFGNVTFNVGNNWSQDGMFAPAKMKGTLTVSSGTITMDGGTGMTTSLVLQNVIVNGTGALKIATGTARNLTLVTGSYTDISTSAVKSSMLYLSTGNLSWTANGNVTLAHDWSAYQHSGSNAGNTNITINGNLSISGGNVDFNSLVDAPLTLTVTGSTTISGTPGHVRMMDSNSRNLTFSTNNLYVNGGTANELMAGNNPLGNAVISVTNDLIITGATSSLVLNNNISSTGSTTLNVGHDVLITDGTMTGSNTNGTFTMNVNRNVTVSGSSARFTGQLYASSNKTGTYNITGFVQVDNGVFHASEGMGNLVVSIVEDLNINNGTFYGIYAPSSVNNGTINLECSNLNYNGGKFILLDGGINDGKTIRAACNNDMSISFLNSTDIFAFIQTTAANNALLNFEVNNNLIIGGNSTGAYFLTSSSSGNETITIGGSLMVSGGDVFFAGNGTTFPASHDIVTNISNNIQLTAGNVRLSQGSGSATVNVTGAVVVSGGILNLKNTTGQGLLAIAGDYTQTGGNFNIHAGTTAITNSCTVTVSGGFTLSDGVFNFDNCTAASGLSEHLLNINGNSFTLGGSAIITHANNLSGNFIFGQIYFTKAGTVQYNRNSSTNEIRHVKYTVNNGTTVDASYSIHGFQMTSVGSSTAANHNSLTVNGILNMGDKVLSARQYPSYYSRVTVNSGGRYRTSHPGGLYSGSATTASSINGFISSINRANYTLDANSTVEYYGTATGVITGIPNGAATASAQKYGNLEINFTGTPDITWLYPEADDEVFVRTSLILTNGELNLDNDHSTSGGGRSINMEAGSTMSRLNGYVRSETEDGSGLIKWTITTNSTKIFHFGFDASTYIPLTFQQTSGAAGAVSVATYRTTALNTPYPPTVTHVRDYNGNDNSMNTVDRFWHITRNIAATANITFTYASSEGAGIILPRAQQWEPVTMGWFPPAGTQFNPTGTTTYAGGLSSFNTWWTLAAGASPLPVDLLNFEVEKAGDVINISWSTATEINCDYFTVEKSSNGILFLPIVNKAGSGNSNTVKFYNAKDTKPFDGINYYRLKETDFDGAYTYSAIKSVYYSSEKTVGAFPNPVTVSSGINIRLPEKGEYNCSLFNPEGKLVLLKQIVAEDAEVTNLKTENLLPGIYFLKILSGETTSGIKILLQ
jgi:hypothetical protein